MNILLVGEGTVSDDVRLKNIGRQLASRDYKVVYQDLYYRDDAPLPLDNIDLVIFSRPHHDSLLLAYQRKGVPIIVDIDDDFRAIPKWHPGYDYVGEGDQFYLMKYENCIYSADLIITATEELAERTRPLNQNIRVIPNGWSNDNFNWYVKRNTYTDSVIIGWAGTMTHREDCKIFVDPVKRILKKYADTKICIGGDVEIYKKFARISESRKLYIPMLPYRSYPLMLSYFDILLAPLTDDPFNRAKSDIKLVDAGAKGIPYIASDMPVYQEWCTGGKLASSQQEWFDILDLYVSSPDVRKELADQGKIKAQERLMSVLVEKWLLAIEEVAQ